MPSSPPLYNLISRTFGCGPVKKLKSALRPLKHALVGKSGIYEVIDIVADKKNGKRNIRVVFDVGAAVGDTAVTFLKSFPRATVYCFEPLPESFAALKKRTARFGERAKCFNCALSDRNGEAEFHVQPNRGGSSFVLRPSDGAGNSLGVKTRRLDDVVKELGVARIDLMKVDIEGWEKEFIEGGKDIFRDKIDNLFMEINPIYYRAGRKHFYIEVLDMIYGAGFSWAGIFGDFFFTKD